MKNAIWMSFIIGLSLCGLVSAQELMWEDTFSDDDVQAFANVAWSYYPPEALPGDDIVEQRDGSLFLQSGNTGFGFGAVLAATNGIPQVILGQSGYWAVGKDNWTPTDQTVVFQLTFTNVTPTAAFMFATRLERLVADYGAFIDTLFTNPLESPGYVLLITPANGAMTLAKYGPSGILATATWQPLGLGVGTFYPAVPKWVKVSLVQGEMKVKIWDGEASAEPADWLISGVDSDPRLTGTFILFGLLNTVNAAAVDQCTIDNVAVYRAGDTSVERVSPVRPESWRLEQNYPNPFNPSTEIRYWLSENCPVELAVFNASGQRVATLVNAHQAAGTHRAVWNGLTDFGAGVPSGLYFCRIRTSGFSQTIKMVLNK